jgi:hypothetical protein
MYLANLESSKALLAAGWDMERRRTCNTLPVYFGQGRLSIWELPFTTWERFLHTGRKKK